MFRILGTLVLLYSAYLAVVYLSQRWALFPGQFRSAPAALEPGDGVEVHWIDTPTGRVEAWLLAPIGRALGEPPPALLFTHGNGELIDDWPEAMEGARRRGFAVLMLEYPGYGRSHGSPAEESIRAAALAAYDWLAERADIDRARIVAYGRSVGGGAACALASERPVAALVLQSAFTSTAPFAARYGVPAFLLRDAFDNRSVVREFPRPVLVWHGQRDNLVPFEHGEALAGAAPQGRLWADECGHNDCPSDWARFWDEVADLARGAAPRRAVPSGPARRSRGGLRLVPTPQDAPRDATGEPLSDRPGTSTQEPT